jgi:ComF family protein
VPFLTSCPVRNEISNGVYPIINPLALQEKWRGFGVRHPSPNLTGPLEGGILLGTVFRLWAKNFINLIYPLSCLICRVGLNPLSDKPLCPGCWSRIEFLPPQNQLFIHRNAKRPPFFFNQAFSVCRYDSVIKDCIHLFKYRSKLSLVKPLSKLMVDFAHNFLDMENIDLILPVPLASSKLRQRQFNQAKLLAKSISCAFSKELKDKLLIKIKPGVAQVNLSRTERLKNVRGSFKVRHQLLLKNILLVDDVLTTGATINECARMLLGAGAKRVDVFTLARSN